ncbi:MAG TPA: NAD(+)/NADH kinase [Nitrososphaera sp.]|nr:NAD(+)/NADH kinase [Nitrososphaera sp.]
MAKIRAVAIMTKRNSVEAKAAAERIVSMLGSKGVSAFAVSPLKLKGTDTVEAEEVKSRRADLVFAIGGDGTTLKAFRTIQGDIPLLSINVGGHRGILSEVDTENMESAIKDILAGKGFYDSRIRIQAFSGRTAFPPALNEILITRADLSRTPTISIKLMGDEKSHRMDGIVISTPTGSTGHNLSIGGPVLHEGMSCLILSPIAPVNKMPQLVIPIEEIVVKSSHKSHLVIDGQENYVIKAGQEVKIARYPHDVRFLRLNKKGMRQLAKLGF